MLNDFNPEVRKNVSGLRCEETAYGYTGRIVYTNNAKQEQTFYFIIPTMHNATIQNTDKLTSIITIAELNKETNLLEPIESDLFKSELTREIQSCF